MVFAQRVLDAMDRWQEEDSPIVLWDIDDTLGKNSITEGDVLEWNFRPTILPLLAYIKKVYPGITMGIMSNRIQVEASLLANGSLSPIAQYINTRSIHSGE